MSDDTRDLIAALRKHDEAMTAGEWELGTGWIYTAEGVAEATQPLKMCINVSDLRGGMTVAEAVANLKGSAALRNLLPDIIAALEQAERLRGVEEALDVMCEQAELGAWDEIACRPSHRRPPGYQPVILPDPDGKTMRSRWREWALSCVALRDKHHTGGEG